MSENSTHKIEVVPVVLEKHPNADTLSIVKVYGYTVVVKTDSWVNKTLAAYIPPDNLVPLTKKEFGWLTDSISSRYNSDCTKLPAYSEEPNPYARITTKRYHQVLSYGLLVPAPEGSVLGDDVVSQLGVIHYNPPEPANAAGEATKGPNLYSPKYNVESFQRYAKELFITDEPVIVTEKLHGASGKWVYHNDHIYCGSRTEWKKESKTSLWWKAMRDTLGFSEWLVQHPDIIVYGEVYGQVQNLKYGTKANEVRIGVFDLFRNGNWVDYPEALALSMRLPWAPLLHYNTPFHFDWLVDLAEGPSLVPGANHFRKGIVIRPMKERRSDSIGRVQLKIISPSYLEKC